MKFSYSLLLCTPITLVLTSAYAQDLQNVQPSLASPASIAEANHELLQGIVVVDNPANVLKTGVSANGVDFKAAPALKSSALQAALASWIGKPLDSRLISQLRNDATIALAKEGKSFSRVIIPEQEVKNGTIQLLIVRGRTGTITVDGAKWFSDSSYLDAMHLKPGQPLERDELDADVDWINRNQFRHVQVVTSPGTETGDVNVMLKANDNFPFQVYAGYNDTGTRTTREGRLLAGFNWGNVFGSGQQFGYQHMQSTDESLLTSDSITYTMMLPWQNLLTFSGSDSHVRSIMPAPLDQTGESSAFGLHYEIPLKTNGSVHHSLNVNLDYKRTNNNLLFSQTPVFGSLTEIMEGTIDYVGSRDDEYGNTSVDTALVFSPGGLFGHNNDSSFDAQRQGAKARYTYFDFNINRNTRLPHDFTWVTNLRAQVSNGSLLGSEQLAFGGSSSVRGYEEGQIYADEGVILRNELRLPAYIRNQFSLQVLGFCDYGRAVIHSPLPTEPNLYTLSSVGLGLRSSITNHLSVSFDYGWQLIDNPNWTRADKSRGHLSVMGTF